MPRAPSKRARANLTRKGIRSCANKERLAIPYGILLARSQPETKNSHTHTLSIQPPSFQRHAPTALIIPHTGGLFPAPGPRPEPVAAASRPAEYLRASRPRAGPQHPPAPAACPASGLSPRLTTGAAQTSHRPAQPTPTPYTPPNPHEKGPNQFAFQVHQHPNTKPAGGTRRGRSPMTGLHRDAHRIMAPLCNAVRPFPLRLT